MNIFTIIGIVVVIILVTSISASMARAFDLLIWPIASKVRAR
jgi:hypothetical protein